MSSNDDASGELNRRRDWREGGKFLLGLLFYKVVSLFLSASLLATLFFSPLSRSSGTDTVSPLSPSRRRQLADSHRRAVFFFKQTGFAPESGTPSSPTNQHRSNRPPPKMHAFNVILIGILSLAPIGLAVPAPRIERRQVARQSSAMVVEQRMRVPFSAFRNPKFTMRPVVNAAIPLPTLPIVSIPLPTVTILPTPTSTPSSSSSTTTRTTTVATSQSTSFAIPTAIPQSPFKLVQSHSGSSFLNGWDFFNYRDPTNGQVNYLDERNARSAGLAYTTDNGSTVLRVDDYTWLGRDQKRNSVRITSKETVKIGSIVVFDAAVMPYGPSVWPAFWS